MTFPLDTFLICLPVAVLAGLWAIRLRWEWTHRWPGQKRLPE